MFDFSEVPNDDLADVWRLIRSGGSFPYVGIRRAVMVELDARMHAIVPGFIGPVQI